MQKHATEFHSMARKLDGEKKNDYNNCIDKKNNCVCVYLYTHTNTNIRWLRIDQGFF